VWGVEVSQRLKRKDTIGSNYISGGNNGSCGRCYEGGLKKTPWGQSTIIDLYGCPRKSLTDPDAPKLLKDFFPALCKKINMQQHGPPFIDKFGEGALHGWSGMQFIETSSITVHLDDNSGEVYVDIFSCKEFDDKVAVDFCRKYWGGEYGSYLTAERGNGRSIKVLSQGEFGCDSNECSNLKEQTTV